MCKTYDAIYELKKHAESDVLVLWIDGAKIKGVIHCCDEHNCKCLKDVVTLKDVSFHCMKTGAEHHMNWINIPSMWIKAFAFECCLVD